MNDSVNSGPRTSERIDMGDEVRTEAARHEPAPAHALETSPANAADFVCLETAETQIFLEAALGERPRVIYSGPSIGKVSPQELALLSTKQHAPGSANVHLRGSLLNELGTGIAGPSGFKAHRNGTGFAADFRVTSVEKLGEHAIILHCSDPNTQIDAQHHFALTPSSSIFTAKTTIINGSSEPLSVEWCSALCLPLDDRLDKLFGFTGRWAAEFQIEEIDLFRGSYMRENKAGRTSHDSFPGLLAGTKSSSETSGLAANFHLGWSGNNRVRVDQHQDGRTILQMGEFLFPGEIQLERGEAYTTPEITAVWSLDGFSNCTQRLHNFVQDELLDARGLNRPRPVHYNTWEAVYFDHAEERLMQLAEQASAVGAERFVLDDGWFGGRRHDKAGLGDWWVSEEVYPQGLHTLASRVRELGMEFGLWFEPEMVNPDSDLFRAHPDWVLHADGVEPVPFRNQFTLDLTKQAVFDYLFDKMTALISEYDIAYIKWDMNRDTNHPGSGNRGAMHQQTKAVYCLMEKLRGAHPKLEIESCSSGGGRVDYAILRHTDRFWASDNNDARERQSIQRGASHFFPLRITGSHVGPRKCHITGRVFSMEFRAASAMFGHMGMELDLLDESEEDREILRRAIALHKQHRALIHGGDFHRLDAPKYFNAVGCVAPDKSEALFSCAQLDPAPMTLPARIRFAGLDPDRSYRTKLVWPMRNTSITEPSIIDQANLLGVGSTFQARALMEHGIQMPLIFPDTCLIFHLTEA
ncbi:alpha-galactosidase [Erythrobacter sp. W53]|uniref:alpha-galactosidase n=1 Tax=Erythrobacter sp. W53 TaxID=3425947 RepID=UPI003D768B41